MKRSYSGEGRRGWGGRGCGEKQGCSRQRDYIYRNPGWKAWHISFAFKLCNKSACVDEFENLISIALFVWQITLFTFKRTLEPLELQNFGQTEIYRLLLNRAGWGAPGWLSPVSGRLFFFFF